jgi:Tol biopolymer transport system component
MNKVSGSGKDKIFTTTSFILALMGLLWFSFQGLTVQAASSEVKKRIYFSKIDDATENSFIYSIDQDGENEVPLIDSCPFGEKTCLLLPIAVSRDGEFVAFSCGSSEKAYMIKSDGSDLKCLGFGDAKFFSPDGQSIVLLGYNDSSNTQKTITTISFQQGTSSACKFPAGFAFLMQFSPDGKYIKIAKKEKYRRGNEVKEVASVYDLDPQTGEIVGKSANPGILSPDGMKIVFCDEIGAFIADADGSGKNYLHSIKSFVKSPSWSRDGMSLLIAGEDSQNGFRKSVRISRLNAERTQITSSKTISEIDFVISAIW